MGDVLQPFNRQHQNITMATRLIVTMLLVTTMVLAGPAREGKWGKHGDYKDGEWEKKYESPDFTTCLWTLPRTPWPGWRTGTSRRSCSPGGTRLRCPPA